MIPPETKYTKVGDSWIGYQVVGEGPVDLVYVTGWGGNNIEAQWLWKPIASMLERMASYSRLILFDRRGSGISDPVRFDALPTWEHLTEDLRAVLDAAKSERTAILAQFDGGQWGILFAATYPERTSALILWNAFARGTRAPDYPIGVSDDEIDASIGLISQVWGTPALVSITDPSFAGDEEAARWYAKLQRLSTTPGRYAEFVQFMRNIDVRPILSSVQAPTLVLHRTSASFQPVEWGRFLAKEIPGARLIEVPGKDSSIHAERSEEIQDYIQDFLEEVRYVEPDRVLATVLFTDIVGSTERAATLGDNKWKELLAEHDRLTRAQVERFRGRLVKTTGDGVLATFDGPGRAIRCALSLAKALRPLQIQIRTGIHTGEIDLKDADIGGVGVHIAARVMGEAGPGEVVCSRTVKDLVAGSEFTFEDRGVRALKGVPDEWQLYAVRAT